MKILLLLLSLLLAGLLPAAAAESAAIVLLDDRESVTVNPDGTFETTDHCVYRILNYDGLMKMRVLPMHFNSSYGTLQVTGLSITKSDGRVITLDPVKNSSVSTENSQFSSEIFDPAQKVLSLTIPGLEIGDTLTVSTLEKVTRARMPGQWSDIAVMQADFPIANYQYTVSMPENMPLQAICVKDEVKGTLKYSFRKENGRLIYQWQAKDVPVAVPENAMPPMYSCTQRILVSTVKSWADISRWYDNLCKEHLAKVNEAMKQKTAALIADKKDDTAKVMALFQFVSQQIRYTGITDEDTAPGYEPHDVDQTFDRRHGVCRDKAALLTAMLKLAGFKAYPVLFMAGAPKDKEVANIYFNHAIVAWEKNPGEYQLMDPTFETTTGFLPGYLAGFPYLVAKPEGETLRLAPSLKAEDNLLDIVSNISSFRNSFAVESTLKFTGIYDQMYRAAFSGWKKEDTEEFFRRQLRQIAPGATLQELQIIPENIRDMSKDLAVVLKYRVPEALPDAGVPGELPLPRSAMVFGLFDSLYANTALQSRRFPLRANPRAVRERIDLLALPAPELVLPDGIDIVEKGLFRMKGKVVKKGDLISEKFFFAIDSMLIPPVDYPKFKSAVDQAKSMWLTRPVVMPEKKSAEDNANTEYLQYSRFIDLKDAHSWDETTHFILKIRNYAGVKEAANLPVPYTAENESVEVTAVVTTADGRKIPISPKEINHVDDPLSLSAPRYLKRRIAMVSFPAVEAGAVIDCTIIRRKSGQLFFYTELPLMDDTPAKIRELIIRHPAKMQLTVSEIPEGMKDSCTYGGKEIIRRYTIHDSSRLPAEPGQPDYALFVPTLRISAGSAAGFAGLLKTAGAKVAGASPEISALARKIVPALPPADKRDKEAAVKAAYALEKFIYKHIRPAALPLNRMFTADHSLPQITLKDGYGSSVDRAILLAAMLRSLDIGFEFIPVSDTPALPETLAIQQKFPRNIFTALLVYLPEYGVILNDSGLYGSAGVIRHHGKIRLYRNQSGKLEKPASIDTTLIRCNVTLQKDLSAAVNLYYTYKGNQLEAVRERFARFTPALEKQYLEKIAAAIAPQAVITGSKFSAAAAEDQLFIQLQIPQFARRVGKFVSLPLPEYHRLKTLASFPGNPRRRTPYLTGGKNSLSLQYTLVYPENFHPVKTLPGKSSGNSAVLWRHNFIRDKGVLRGNITWQLAPALIQPGNYRELLEINRNINRLENQNILFTVE